jgi:hypothetical protein
MSVGMDPGCERRTLTSRGWLDFRYTASRWDRLKPQRVRHNVTCERLGRPSRVSLDVEGVHEVLRLVKDLRAFEWILPSAHGRLLVVTDALVIHGMKDRASIGA